LSTRASESTGGQATRATRLANEAREALRARREVEDDEYARAEIDAALKATGDEKT
jgi:hypothetical protein